MTENRSVAVVIGSGGVKCAASIGLWQTLREEGIQVSMLIGSSGGGMYAAAIEEMTLNFWTGDLMTGYLTNLKAVTSGDMRFTEKSGLVSPPPPFFRPGR